MSSSATDNPTTTTTTPETAAAAAAASNDASGRQPAAAAPSAAELARAKVDLRGALRHFPDFPIAGIDFVDIMPLFRQPAAHAALLRALELQILHFGAGPAPDKITPAARPDVVVGLDARGFLFGPSLALRLGAGFAAVRKKGKLPGPCVTASYEKEYGADYFQMQEDAVRPGQKVLVVDDIIATGGSAAAAGQLVKQLGGELMGYLFILEIPGLNGKAKLGDVPVVTLLKDA